MALRPLFPTVQATSSTQMLADSVALSNNATNASGQMGTEELTFTQGNLPSGEVTVMAWADANLKGSGDSVAQLSVQVSFDGGSTWTSAGTGPLSKLEGSDGVTDRVPLVAHGVAADTPTGDVMVRAYLTVTATSGTNDYEGGRLSALAFGAVDARDWSDGGDPTTSHADWSDGGSPSTVHTDYSDGGSP